MSTERLSLRAKTIAIVGAGPSGVIAAKYLRAEKAFDKIVLYEQRNAAGGIWNYTGDQRDEDLFSIPQTNPHGKNQDPDWISPAAPKKQGGHIVNGTNSIDGNTHATNGANDDHKVPSFLSPMYANLETNIPRGLMGFQDLDWPSDSQLFPTHQTVLQYITDYGADVQDLVQYETQVVNAEPLNTSRDAQWSITTRNIRTNQTQEDVVDALVVANGHFITPYVPDMQGIKEWNKQHPGMISHSKYYRHPSEYSGKKVIVVGNSASGADISAQVCKHSSRPLLWSSKSVSLFSATHGSGGDTSRRNVPPIARFTTENRGVVFEDGSVESDIDAIIFATGYFYSVPFLENVQPALITDGSHINHTYQHLFFAPQPTLSFLALNQRVIPFPVAEAQAAVVARVYSSRLSLPSLSEMQNWEQGVVDEQGDGRNFHLLPFPKDGKYINEMSDWANSAETREGLENDGHGKVPPRWGEWEFWCRENFPAIRRKFGEMGQERKSVRSLEQVGFEFEKYQEEKTRKEEQLLW